MRKELALTTQQVWRINKVVDDRAHSVQPAVDDYEIQRTAVDKMMADRVVDDITIQFQIRKMESAWSEIQASRWLMIYRISRVLTDDQNKKLPAIFERHHGRGGEPHPHPSSHE